MTNAPRNLVVACVALLLVISALPALAAAAPRIHFTDVPSGTVRGGADNLGAPITLFGTGFGAARGGSTVTIGGVKVARYLVWGRRNAHNRSLDMVVVQPGRAVRSGRVEITVAGRAARGPVFTARPGRVRAIATDGSDAGQCTLARPCATLQHVVDTARAGDRVLVRGGDYDEGEVWLRAGGPPLAITRYPGEEPVFVNASRPMIAERDGVTIAGLNFRNGKSAGIPDTGLPGPRAVRLIDNTFTGEIGFSAVDSHGDGHLIAGNVCRVSGSSVGTQGHCFYVSYGRGVRLLDNIAAGATGYGIHVFDQQRSSGDFRREIRDLLIQGNRVGASRERSGLILAMGDEGGLGNRIEGVVVRGNTFAGNNHAGIVVGPRVARLRIVGNRVGDNGRQGVSIGDESTIRDVRVTGNTIIQSANRLCRTNCTWFPLAAVQVGARAGDVVVSGNRLRGGGRVVRG